MENLIKSLEKIDEEANMIALSMEKDSQKKNKILENRLKEEKRNILNNQNRKLGEIKKEIYEELENELKELEYIYEIKKREMYELYSVKHKA